MFCSKCGAKLTDSAYFCQRCGAKVSTDRNLVLANQNGVSKELDREALKIYLRDVLALECAVKHLRKKQVEYDNAIKTMESKNYVQSYHVDQHVNYKFSYWDNFFFYYDGNKIYVLVTGEGCRIAPARAYNEGPGHKYPFWKAVEDILQRLDDDITWNAFINVRYASFFEKGKKKRAHKEKFINAYNDFMRNAPSQYQKNYTELLKVKRQREALCKEMEKLRIFYKDCTR